MNNKKNLSIFIIAVLLIAGIFVFFTVGGRGITGFGSIETQMPLESVSQEPSTVPVSDKISRVEYVSFLEDVTGGLEIAGFTPEEEVFGTVVISERNSEYLLNADFENLPILGDDYFYEGWLVNSRPPIEFVSTGRALLNKEGFYINEFNSNVDIMMYDQYVLTIEPNDGDPAPAAHILEGDVVWEGSEGSAE